MSEKDPETLPPPSMVGGASAYGGKKVSGFMFGLRPGKGLVVWEGVLRREDRQWADVPPDPQVEAELRKAFDMAMAKAPQGAVARTGRGVGMRVIHVRPSGKARVDAGLPGSKKVAYWVELSPNVCKVLLDLWKVPLPVSEVPRSLPARFQFSTRGGRGSLGEEPATAHVESTRFVWESQLQDYLVANWSTLPLSNSLEIIGHEYPTSDRGRIDILCRNRDGSGYTVIELKRGLTGDAVVGQVQRYMGWVRATLIEGGQAVLGVIICHDADPKLMAAVSVAHNVDVYAYEATVAPEGALHFTLRKLSKQGEHEPKGRQNLSPNAHSSPSGHP